MESADEIRAIDTPEGHQKFMKAQWRDFAAFAWEKYLSEGRGAVIIDLRNASSNAPAVQVPTYYVADGSKRLAERGGWPSDEMAQVVQEYDPKRDVVFIFLQLDGDVIYYQASDELTPPQASKMKRS